MGHSGSHCVCTTGPFSLLTPCPGFVCHMHTVNHSGDTTLCIPPAASLHLLQVHFLLQFLRWSLEKRWHQKADGRQCLPTGLMQQTYSPGDEPCHSGVTSAPQLAAHNLPQHGWHGCEDKAWCHLRNEHSEPFHAACLGHVGHLQHPSAHRVDI